MNNIQESDSFTVGRKRRSAGNAVDETAGSTSVNIAAAGSNSASGISVPPPPRTGRSGSLGSSNPPELSAFNFASADRPPAMPADGHVELPSIFGSLAQSQSIQQQQQQQSPSAGSGNPTLQQRTALSISPDFIQGNISPGGASMNTPYSETPTNSRAKKIAWKCAHCSYVTLAMDHKGKPLPLETDAFGRPLPLFCPRCLFDHVEWDICTPFNEFGDYANIPGAFASSVRVGNQSLSKQGLLKETVGDHAFAPTACTALKSEHDQEQDKKQRAEVERKEREKRIGQKTSTPPPQPTSAKATTLEEILGLRGASGTPRLSSRARYLQSVLRGDIDAIKQHEAAVAEEAAEKVEKKPEKVSLSSLGGPKRASSGGGSRTSEKNSPMAPMSGHGGYSSFSGVRNRKESIRIDKEDGTLDTSSAALLERKRRIPRAYFCKRCDRRLMRCDHTGNVVPLDVDVNGHIVPLFCPGCKTQHSEWEEMGIAEKAKQIKIRNEKIAAGILPPPPPLPSSSAAVSARETPAQSALLVDPAANSSTDVASSSAAENSGWDQLEDSALQPTKPNAPSGARPNGRNQQKMRTSSKPTSPKPESILLDRQESGASVKTDDLAPSSADFSPDQRVSPLM